MKSLMAVAALFLLNAGATAQANPSPSDGSGLEVISQKWRSIVRNPAMERDPVQDQNDRVTAEQSRIEAERQNEILRARGMPTREVPSPELKLEPRQVEPTVVYSYEAKFRNNGAKDISALTWEFIFFSTDTGQEVGRRKFESKKAISNGKTSTLVMQSVIPPTGTVDATKAGSRSAEKYTEKVVVLTVEYSDGTKWPL